MAHSLTVELTAEQRAKWRTTTEQIINLVVKNTTNPLEALMLLHLCREALEETTGVKLTGAFTVDTDSDGPPPPGTTHDA
jgi:ribosome maturation protein Sdo1